MASYVNVGAQYKKDVTDIPTKAALKRAIAEDPGQVWLYETSMGKEGVCYQADSLDIGVKYSVTGPNPYTSRKWYATIEKRQDGKIVVS